MKKSQILETLVKAYYEERQIAKRNSQLGEHEMASQSLHQAYGIVYSAEVLGINGEDFEKAYKAYRSLQWQLKKQEA